MPVFFRGCTDSASGHDRFSFISKKGIEACRGGFACLRFDMERCLLVESVIFKKLWRQLKGYLLTCQEYREIAETIRRTWESANIFSSFLRMRS